MMRITYIDFCKVFAMFLVTMAHCAQQLSGEIFPPLLVTKDAFISFNMAVFMTASGFVMNVDKMRISAIVDYLWSKTIRLILPMTTWFLVFCIASNQFDVTQYWTCYWYLSAMFVCLATICILARIVPQTWIICIVSVIILSLLPFVLFERSCYMIPFLWIGYYLRRGILRIGLTTILWLAALYVILYYFWDVSYSIYVTPFHIWEVDGYMLFAYVYRLIIGAVGSILFISLSCYLASHRVASWIDKISKYGKYTLVFYTMSFVLNAILRRVMWHIGYLNTPGVLDLVAMLIALAMMTLMFFFQKKVESSKILRLLLLGEK